MVPEVNFEDLGVELLPSAQRLPLWEIFAKSQLSQNKRLYGLFVRFMNGSKDLLYWDVLTVYAKGDLVKDLHGVYESLSDSNTGNALGDTTYWLKVLDSFIGKRESVHYNGRYLTLTYALNRIFGTTFLQPPYPAPYDFGLGGGTFSDIYITTDPLAYYSVIMFDDLTPPDTMYDSPAGYFMFDDLVVGGSTTYAYTIHMPLAVFNALGATNPIRDAVVRSFVDKYNVTGLKYIVVTY